MVLCPCGSRSTSNTLCFFCARQAERLIAVVVFPQPPFWLATATTRIITSSEEFRQALLQLVGHRPQRNSAAGKTRNGKRPPHKAPPELVDGENMANGK